MPVRAIRLALAVTVFGTGLFGDVEWNRLRQLAQAEARAGKLSEAEQTLRSALSALPNQKNIPAAALWNDIGAVQNNRGMLSEAKASFERAISINNQLQSPDIHQSAIALNNLATLAGAQQKLAIAEKYLRRASGLLDAAKQTDSNTAALIRANLALTFAQEGRYIDAGPLYRRAGIEVKEHFGENSIEYARLLMNRALFELQTGAYRAAVEDGKEAVSVQQSIAYVPPSDRALAVDRVGSGLLQLNDLAAAEPVLMRAVSLWRAVPQAREQLVASLDNLGTVYERQHQLSRARALEMEAVSLMNQAPVLDPGTRASVLSSLGRIALAERKHREAREYLTEARKLSEPGDGAGQLRYASTLSNLAELESAEKHYRRAEELYRKALSIDELRLGADHPEIASDLSNVATQLVYQKRRDQAIELYERARAIAEKNFGPVNTVLAHTWRNMAVAYYQNKQYQESAFAYSKAFSASPDPNISLWLHEYALALRRLDRFGEAEAAETRALGIEVRNMIASQKNPSDSGTL